MTINEVQPGAVLSYSCWGTRGAYPVTVVKVGPKKVRVRDHREPIHEWWAFPRHLFPLTLTQDGGR